MPHPYLDYLSAENILYDIDFPSWNESESRESVEDTESLDASLEIMNDLEMMEDINVSMEEERRGELIDLDDIYKPL